MSARNSNAQAGFAPPAFTLVEVVIATGIFSFVIVALLGLFIPVVQSVAETNDAGAAAAVAELVRVRLEQEGIAVVPGRFESAEQVQVQDNNPGYAAASDHRLFYADRGGVRIGAGDDPVWNGQDGGKFFEITLVRNEGVSPAANDATAGFLAFTLHVRWPAFTSDGQALTDNTRKQSANFNTVLLR